MSDPQRNGGFRRNADSYNCGKLARQHVIKDGIEKERGYSYD
jgi:hypothetical protein